MKKETPFILLRVGLAFAFLYAAISAFITPSSWLGFLPSFLRTTTILALFSIVEIIVALWLLSGKKVFYASILSVLMLLGIILFNLGALEIIFRDVTILLAALALVYHSKK